MTKPTIIFSSSFLLEDLLKPHAETMKIKPLDIIETHKRVEHFNKAWDKEGLIVLKGIQKALGIGFAEKTISIWVSGSMRGGRSMPLIVSAFRYNKQPVDIVMHELIHRISVRPNVNWNFRPSLEKLIPQQKNNKLVFNHVYVHAILEYVYRDVFRDIKRLEIDKKTCEKSPAYKEAWKIVEQVGYKKIIGAIKN